MELPVDDRTALLAHPRLPEAAVRFQHSSVMVALADVLPGDPVAAWAGIVAPPSGKPLRRQN